jgi:hypothetical protein
MATAVFDQVTQAIRDRLAASVESVDVVLPSLLANFSPRDWQAIISPGNPEPSSEWSFQGNPPVQAFAVPYVITCYRRQSNDDERPIDELLAEFSSAVMATITEPADWYTWGGAAVNTQLGPINKWQGDDASAAAHQLQLNVIYRHSELNPYTPR